MSTVQAPPVVSPELGKARLKMAIGEIAKLEGKNFNMNWYFMFLPDDIDLDDLEALEYEDGLENNASCNAIAAEKLDANYTCGTAMCIAGTIQHLYAEGDERREHAEVYARNYLGISHSAASTIFTDHDFYGHDRLLDITLDDAITTLVEIYNTAGSIDDAIDEWWNDGRPMISEADRLKVSDYLK